MSGGSFNYLCHRDLQDLIHGFGEEWDWMLAELDELAPDVASEMRKIREETNEFVEKYGDLWDRLTEVLRAVEWWRSNDWGKDQVIKSIEKFRADSAESRTIVH